MRLAEGAEGGTSPARRVRPRSLSWGLGRRAGASLLAFPSRESGDRKQSPNFTTVALKKYLLSFAAKLSRSEHNRTGPPASRGSTRPSRRGRRLNVGPRAACAVAAGVLSEGNRSNNWMP